MASLLDGKALAAKIQKDLTQEVKQLTQKVGRPPGLAVLMVGDNPASAAYVRGKNKACARVGITSFGQHLPTDTSQEQLTQIIHALNANNAVDGILIQLPLPQHLNSTALLREILPEKDADGLHPFNLGALLREEPGLQSCTPAGVIQILDAYQIPLAGKHAVVIGRSILVGKPLALMLLQKNATVTIAHSRTQDLGAIARTADILVAAAGRPGLVTADMVKPGAVVIDVGINRIESDTGKAQLIGDVDFTAVEPVADWITPVPGGVGPMTVTLLLQNTVRSYRQRSGA